MKKRLPFIFTFVWVFPWVLYSYAFWANDIIGGNCYVWANVHSTTHRVLVLVKGTLVLSIIPSTIIIVLYGKMAIAIKFGFSGDDQSGDKAKRRLSKTQKNIFSTCLVIVAAFLCSWCYYMFALTAVAIKKGMLTDGLSTVFLLADAFLQLNSTVNPLIYAIR